MILAPNNRDAVLFERIGRFLEGRAPFPHLFRGKGAEDRSSEPSSPGEAMATADGVIVFLSRETVASARARAEVQEAVQRGTPCCVLVFPGIAVPEWVHPDDPRVDLEGFVDHGPALPPATDENQFFQRSVFVDRSLSSLERFVEWLASGLNPTAQPPTDSGD